ncbi:hypothetical protein [Solicola sp. PLA-1-18]|uniref:hypothetical protein n=1 Tax=Solicola sp. PLA-1-18 TaxID=3380532 RepID=UPI003B78F0D1
MRDGRGGVGRRRGVAAVAGAVLALVLAACSSSVDLGEDWSQQDPDQQPFESRFISDEARPVDVPTADQSVAVPSIGVDVTSVAFIDELTTKTALLAGLNPGGGADLETGRPPDGWEIVLVEFRGAVAETDDQTVRAALVPGSRSVDLILFTPGRNAGSRSVVAATVRRGDPVELQVTNGTRTARFDVRAAAER